MGSLGIKRVEAIHYFVHDLQRSRKFYTERMDFAEIGKSNAALEARGHQISAVFQAGGVTVMCSQPVGEGGRAWRYLRKHPDGVGAVIFEVEDIEHTFRLLEERGGTMISDVERLEGGAWASFSITTPLGDTTFRFVQRQNYPKLFPGLQLHERPQGGDNRFGFVAFDHLTSNFQTMAPTLLWFEHVMGFERYWDIKFHTDDVKRQDHGSGLRSQVMWDPRSQIKFANNEPMRPHFKQSQINIFGEQNRGDGVQHVALGVRDILDAVKSLRERGVEFMPTPNSYYEALPARLKSIGVNKIDEDIAHLQKLGILVDGERDGQYMLQIFLKDSASLYGEDKAGPFFFEIIARKGDKGFGGGNFRALFESIERQQKSDGIVK